MKQAKEAVSEAYATGERPVVQAINMYNDVGKARNLISERLQEWYSIYAPELRLENPAVYAKIVSLAGKDTKNVSDSALAEIFGSNKQEIEKAKGALMSGGRSPETKEYENIKRVADSELALINIESELDGYLKDAVPKVMPNIAYLVDYKIAAELLAKAGSLNKLGYMPASTIQLLGAEKALFRHMKFGSKSPKYGVLFKLKEIAVADRSERGKIARIYATKISIAARADAFSKRFIGNELKESLMKGLEEIRGRRAIGKEKVHVQEPGRDNNWKNRPRKGQATDRRRHP